MGHETHAPGTVPDCPECQALAYEPGWYRAMLQGDRPQSSFGSVDELIVLPDPDDERAASIDEQRPLP